MNKLVTYNFTFKEDKKKTPLVGVMAQDLQKVFPDAVTKNKNGYLMIRKEDMFYAMVNSIKQLDKIVQGLVNQLKIAVAKIQTIDDKVIALVKVDQAHLNQLGELKTGTRSMEVRLAKLEQREKGKR